MGKQSSTYPACRLRCLSALFLILCAVARLTGQGPVAAPPQALAIPLLFPAGLAYDGQGNLIFAESGRHLIRSLSPTGALITLAGTGTQGLSGDGGPATQAALDTPSAVAFDGGGNLYFADTHNHRIRRIDAGTGVVTTVILADSPVALAFDPNGRLVFADRRTEQIRRLDPASGIVVTLAGNGTQGAAGDGGPALKASLDTPSGLAFNGRGDLFLADTHNGRIRRVDAVTGIIATVASIPAPAGMSADAAGNLFVTASRRSMILRVDGVSGSVQVVAGSGVEGFLGDGGPAPAAALDQPADVTISPAGLPTLADAANGRIRQIDAAGVVHTIAGLGASAGSTLTLSAPSVVLYGTGSLQASLNTSLATGSVNFFDATDPAHTLSLGSVTLQANTASEPAGTLSAGVHRLFATYAGDTLHASAESPTLPVTIAPAPARATPNALALVFGAPVPTLTGTLDGVLAQDAASVRAVFTSAATSTSDPGSYSIAASLSGTGSANYSLTSVPAAVVISRAPAAVTLASGLQVHVASTTSGTPSGIVTLLDGSTPYSRASLSATGDAAFSSANLSAGSHTLTAVYAGDRDFLSAASAPLIVAIGPTSVADFSLAATGQTTVTVPSGTAAQFGFAVAPVNGGLPSPLLLTASGLPSGAVATFNPTYLPPAGTPSAFVLTVQTPRAALAFPGSPLVFAAILPLLWIAAGQGRRRLRLALSLALIALVPLGCGDRINSSTAASTAGKSYTIVVTATGTQASGATVQHSATVTLVLQP